MDKITDKIEIPYNIIEEPVNNYFSDVFTPWEVKEQLEIWKEVKWTLGWNYASWYGSRLSSAWIWQVTIPVWFTAKLVKIRAVLAWWEWAWSEWTYNWTWDWICIYWYNQNWWYYSWSSYDTTKIIYIRNYNWNTTRATLFVSWTNMYLDFGTMNVDVFYIWEAFG